MISAGFSALAPFALDSLSSRGSGSGLRCDADFGVKNARFITVGLLALMSYFSLS